MNPSNLPSPTLASMWLHSHEITISSEAHITVRPQTRAFRPRHVLIPEEATRGIMLRGIVVGNHHQFTYDQAMIDRGIPASRFAIADDRLRSLPVLRQPYGPNPIDVDLYAHLVRGVPPFSIDAIACAQDLLFIVEPLDLATHTPRIFEAFLLGHMA